MKKGFTLVELLAIIILLASMSLVTFLSLNNMIKKTKIDNDKDLIITIVDEATILYNDYVFNNKQDQLIGKNVYDLMTTKDKPEQGNLYINGLGQISIAVVYNDRCYTKNFDETNINYSNYSDECVVKYVDPVLNGADPELDDGMIPVVIASDGTLTKADLKKEWYSYEDKKWANMVLVSEDVRSEYMNAEAGSVIDTSKVLAYYVWVPRYKYQIFNTKEDIKVNQDSDLNTVQLINIVFENKYTPKSKGSKKGTFVTHPAFTFGNDELNGIWVGKFETTGTPDQPTILPNVTSLRHQSVSNQFITSLRFANNALNSDGSIIHYNNNIYGINNTDAHMMKNIEWGAVAYLTTSKYGQGLTEVRINNSNAYITGCAATNPAADLPDDYTGHVSGCQNAYNTEIGVLASTTGNITGIYDMSGGSLEYVMGVTSDGTGAAPTSGRNASSNSGFTGLFTCPTCDVSSGNDSNITSIIGLTFPNSKYYDLYDYGTTDHDAMAFSRGKLGDATIELGSFTIDYTSQGYPIYYSNWQNALTRFIHSYYPWMARGGIYHTGKNAGILSFDVHTGGVVSYISFRSVLAK